MALHSTKTCLLALGFLWLVGCAGPAGLTAGAPGERGASARPPGESTTSRAPGKRGGSVPIVATGVLTRDGEGVEICSGEAASLCAGLRVVGPVEEVWLSTPDKSSVWQIPGDYDGLTLTINGAAKPTSIGVAVDYRNPCPEFQRPAPGINPDERLSAKAEALVAEYAHRLAGKWWDRERQTMVVWVTGDAAELQQAARSLAPKERICVAGNARFSERALEAARARADQMLAKSGTQGSWSSLNVVKNHVEYRVEALDAPTAEQLARDVGEAVRVVAFIQLLQHRLAELPVPAARGDIQLVKAQTRSQSHMNALGRFFVHYDSALRCVYLQGGDGERLLPVWPFGYWASSSPLQVFDYDDKLVATPGTLVEFGGGTVEAKHVRAKNSCGATEAWMGEPIRRAADSSPTMMNIEPKVIKPK